MVDQVWEAVFEDLARVAAANEGVGMFEGRGDDGPEDGEAMRSQETRPPG